MVHCSAAKVQQRKKGLCSSSSQNGSVKKWNLKNVSFFQPDFVSLTSTAKDVKLRQFWLLLKGSLNESFLWVRVLAPPTMTSNLINLCSLTKSWAAAVIFSVSFSFCPFNELKELPDDAYKKSIPPRLMGLRHIWQKN